MCRRVFGALVIAVGLVIVPALTAGCQSEPADRPGGTSAGATTQEAYTPINVNSESDVRVPSLGGGGGHGK
jgi:hypothetical protein